MIKMMLAFIALFALVFICIQLFLEATGRERIQLLKLLSYCMLITVLVALIVISIVILF